MSGAAEKINPDWSPEEAAVIQQIAKGADMEPHQVLRQSLRLYQLVQTGNATVNHPRPPGCPDFPEDRLSDYADPAIDDIDLEGGDQ